MLKKLLTLGAMLLAFPIVSAHASIYAGLGGGVGFDSSRFEISQGSNVTSNNGTGVYGMGGAILGTDNVFCNNFYLGVEGQALYSGLDQSIRRSTTSFRSAQPGVDLTNTFRYLTSVHLGLKYCNLIPYISVGAGGGIFKLHIHNDSSAPAFGVPPNYAINISKNVYAFTPGLGLKINITPCLLGGIEYDYLVGPTIRRTLSDPVTGPWDYSEKIREHTLLATLAYKFF